MPGPQASEVTHRNFEYEYLSRKVRALPTHSDYLYTARLPTDTANEAQRFAQNLNDKKTLASHFARSYSIPPRHLLIRIIITAFIACNRWLETDNVRENAPVCMMAIAAFSLTYCQSLS